MPMKPWIRVAALGGVGLVGWMLWPSLAPAPAQVVAPSAAPTTAPSPLDDEPAAVPSQEEAVRIRKLIQNLGDDDYLVRESATRELMALGEIVLPAGREAMASTDPEVQLRATKIVRDLERKSMGDNGALVPGIRAMRVKTQTDAKEISARDDKGRRIQIVQNDKGIDITVTAINPDDGQDAVFQCRARDAADLKAKDPRLYRFYERIGGGPKAGEWNSGGLNLIGGGVFALGAVGEADDLETLRLRLRGQMKAAKTPEDQQKQVLQLVQDLRGMEAAKSNDTDEIKQLLERRDKTVDALWAKMDELKLTDPGAALIPPTKLRLNAAVADLPPDGPEGAVGVRVVQVAAASRAEKIGLAPEDIIRKVNQKAVRSVAELRAAVGREKAPLVLEVLREGETVELREKP
jgi:hypothetical protein